MVVLSRANLGERHFLIIFLRLIGRSRSIKGLVNFGTGGLPNANLKRVVAVVVEAAVKIK